MRHFGQLILCRVNAQLAQVGRHVDFTEEIFCPPNSLEGDLLLCQTLPVAFCPAVNIDIGDVPHPKSKLIEPRQAVTVDIPGPASPDRGKARSVRHVKHSSDLVLQLMAGPVPAAAATAGQSVMRKTSRPHDFGSRLVVL